MQSGGRADQVARAVCVPALCRCRVRWLWIDGIQSTMSLQLRQGW